MNKLDRYDALKLQEALHRIKTVRDYNNIPSSPLYKKLNTIIGKLDAVLSAETTDEVQREYKTNGFIGG